MEKKNAPPLCQDKGIKYGPETANTQSEMKKKKTKKKKRTNIQGRLRGDLEWHLHTVELTWKKNQRAEA
jgi:hypothetical protein